MLTWKANLAHTTCKTCGAEESGKRERSSGIDLPVGEEDGLGELKRSSRDREIEASARSTSVAEHVKVAATQ